MPDKFNNFPSTIDGPATDAFAIVANDSIEFSQPTRALWVGSTGNVSVTFANREMSNTTIVIPSVPGGTLLAVRVKKVNSSNTTAGGFVGFV